MTNVNNHQSALPAAAKLIRENNINVNEIIGTGKDGRITKGDVISYLNIENTTDSENTKNKKMSKKSDKNLVEDILVPALGESIVDATVSKWYKKNGDLCELDEPIIELETAKVSLEVPASIKGIIEDISVDEGDTVAVGQKICVIRKVEPSQLEKDKDISSTEIPPLEEDIISVEPNKNELSNEDFSIEDKDYLNETDLELGTESATSKNVYGKEERIRMTGLRRAIASRLKEAQNTAAILTTYNEVDMSKVIQLRNDLKEDFQEKYKVKLGFMSFFVRAVISALREYPAVNAEIRGDDIIYKDFYNIGVAVGTPNGLVVPVLKNSEGLTLAGIEKRIFKYAESARNGKLTIDDMSDGTFTISNGGVYGSMMSSPILNPPQSGILGMHNIQKRAVVVDDEIVARPMMYLALSYDHRIIDGKEAVSFLVNVKKNIENPWCLLLND